MQFQAGFWIWRPQRNGAILGAMVLVIRFAAPTLQMFVVSVAGADLVIRAGMTASLLVGLVTVVLLAHSWSRMRR